MATLILRDTYSELMKEMESLDKQKERPLKKLEKLLAMETSRKMANTTLPESFKA